MEENTVDKEKILEMSRKENKNKDIAELDVEKKANNIAVEIESLGQLVPVESGSTISGEEVWSLTPGVPAPAANDEAALMDIIAKYIEK